MLDTMLEIGTRAVFEKELVPGLTNIKSIREDKGRSTKDSVRV